MVKHVFYVFMRKGWFAGLSGFADERVTRNVQRPTHGTQATLELHRHCRNGGAMIIKIDSNIAHSHTDSRLPKTILR
jgi:hypothetical protein